MQFNSITFLLFFTGVAASYFLPPYRLHWLLLLLASYFFYMCWKPAYALLILAVTGINYICALLVASTQQRKTKKIF